MGNLQYRSDTDRLIVNSGGNLLAECCCDECSDPPCTRWEECCERGYSELLTLPHYIVLGDTDTTALGSPDCVVYNDCCYCSASTTDKPENVDPSAVVASAENNCGDCSDNEGVDCESCYCTACTPTWKKTISVTLAGFIYPFEHYNGVFTLTNSSAPGVSSCGYSGISIPSPSGSYVCAGGISFTSVTGLGLFISVDCRNYDLFGCSSAPGGGAGGSTSVTFINNGDLCDVLSSYTIYSTSLFNSVYNEAREYYPELVNGAKCTVA